MFSLVSVCWVVCQNDNAKLTERISMTIGGRMGCIDQNIKLDYILIAELHKIKGPGFYLTLLNVAK